MSSWLRRSLPPRSPPSRSSPRVGPRLTALAVAAQLVLLGALAWLPGARATPQPALLLWAAVLAVHAAAVTAQARRPLGRGAVWSVGVGGRLLLFPLAPHYSDDTYRYLWDGWVQTQGVNPYLNAPADPALAELRTAWWPLINHPEVPTVYPPAAQLVFWGLATIAASVPLFKLAWLAADLATAWIVERIASQRGALADGSWRGPRPPTAVGGSPPPPPSGAAAGTLPLALYLWSPLLVVEVAWSGHLEPLGLLPMMAAVWAVERSTGRLGAGSAGAGALLGLGAAVKFAPLAALPALCRRRGLLPLASAAAVLGLLYLPFAGAGTVLFAGLGEYAERWAFNPGLFRLLEALLPGALSARLAAAGIVVAVALWAAWRRWALDRTLLWTVGAALLVSPTVHPWYVLWILPLAALRRNRAWLLLTGTVFFAYWGRDTYQATGGWPFPDWLGLLVYLPFAALLVADALAPHRLARGGHVAGREQAGERGGRHHADRDQLGHGPSERHS